MITIVSDYETKKARLQEQMRHSAGGVRLGKQTSNLFRAREKNEQAVLSVRDFNHVIAVNAEEEWADVEGMTTYEEFVNETLKHGLIPTVVPQLKTITIGGAVAGVGIEATSFRYGLVHETVLEMEILLADGEVVVCSATQNQDLFYGFPNSYGTLGYALRLKVNLIPVKPFVKVEHARYSDAKSYFDALEKVCREGRADGDTRIDFVDGVMFGPTEMYITTGIFLDKPDESSGVSDYTYLDIYYKSIRIRKIDYLSVGDFLWRWDTDWFWCSKVIGAQNPLLRRLLGRNHLNSAFYSKLMRWDHRWQIGKKISTSLGKREEWVIQDVDIPIENAPTYAEFFFRDINIRPVWICPIGAYDKAVKFNLYPLDPAKLYINFGFWDAVPSQKEEGYYNRLVEAKVSELHGKKGLYSDSFYTLEEFWKIYDKNAYDALKRKYDPGTKLKDLYQKCVKRQ